MKKYKLFAIAAALTSVMVLTACGGGAAQTTPVPVAEESAVEMPVEEEPVVEEPAVEEPVAEEVAPEPEFSDASDFNTAMPIAVISREDGSGTRGAFIELLGIERDGIDHTFAEADIQNGTSAVITSVAGNTYAIGYISLGSLNDTVSAVSIDGVPATPATVQDGSYPIFRAFYFAVGDLTAEAQDFLNFVLSAEGQATVASRGYISVDASALAFEAADVSGTVVITGSTSVFPIVELLAEQYGAINPNVNIEVHSTGSSAGITAARDGTADLGMTSRSLNDAELAEVAAVEIAYDGLAVIVNNDNPLSTISAEEVRQVFEGEIFNWSNFLN